MKQASVDTALLRALLLTSEHDVAPFLELPNRCVLEDCESFLREDSKWGDIVALYKSKRLDRKALELLKDLGEGTKSRDPKARELGINGTIAYIQKLDPANATHRELILEYSEWVLLRAPHHQALPMFYSNPKKVITPRLVYEHLRKVLPRNLECQAGYLAKMLEDPILKALPECRNSSIHEALIDVYVALVKKYNGCGKVKDAEAIKARLQSFLKTSERYDPESVKQQFAGEDFYREMTIVHCKLEQHEDALRILAHKLNSFDECVAYCQNESVAKPPPSAAAPSAAPTSALAKGREKRQELHFILFTLLLNPDDKSPPKVEQALRLLNLYPDKVNCLKALKMLPADTKVHDVAQWIVQVLKDVSVKNRETKIYMNLCKSEHHQVAVQRVYRLREKFVIDQKTVCPVCKRKIGNSIVAYYPNGKLVHKICATSLLQQSIATLAWSVSCQRQPDSMRDQQRCKIDTAACEMLGLLASLSQELPAGGRRPPSLWPLETLWKMLHALANGQSAVIPRLLWLNEAGSADKREPLATSRMSGAYGTDDDEIANDGPPMLGEERIEQAEWVADPKPPSSFCMNYGLVIINVVLLLSATALIVVGSKARESSITRMCEPCKDISTAATVIGSIFLCFSLLGMFALVRRAVGILVVYVVILFALVLAIVALTIASVYYAAHGVDLSPEWESRVGASDSVICDIQNSYHCSGWSVCCGPNPGDGPFPPEEQHKTSEC
eukprot:gene20880-32206_t